MFSSICYGCVKWAHSFLIFNIYLFLIYIYFPYFFFLYQVMHCKYIKIIDLFFSIKL